MNTNTAGLIRAVQTGRRKLGMTKEDYRALLEGVSGKTSSKELTAYELKEVLSRMRKAGFHGVYDDQLQKIRSLWFGMYDDGLVRSRSEQSIAAYIRRITGKSTKECDTKDLQRVIETLKQWIGRVYDSAGQECIHSAFDAMPAASPILQ